MPVVSFPLQIPPSFHRSFLSLTKPGTVRLLFGTDQKQRQQCGRWPTGPFPDADMHGCEVRESETAQVCGRCGRQFPAAMPASPQPCAPAVRMSGTAMVPGVGRVGQELGIEIGAARAHALPRVARVFSMHQHPSIHSFCFVIFSIGENIFLLAAPRPDAVNGSQQPAEAITGDHLTTGTE